MIPSAEQQIADATADAQMLLVVNAGNPAAADLIDQWAGGPAMLCASGELDPTSCSTNGGVDSVVVMLPQPWCSVNDPELQKTLKFLQDVRPQHACFVTGCTAHFQEPATDGGADEMLDELETLLCHHVPDDVRVTVIRTGFLLSPRSETTNRLRRWSWLSPLLLPSLRSTFVSVDELARLTADVLSRHSETRFRGVTLLGSRRSWQEVMADVRPFGRRSLVQRILVGVSRILFYCGVGLMLQGLLRLSGRLRPQWRVLAFDTIIPNSEAELLSLCHRQNIGHVAVCGYNNGVTHFGWDYGSRTAVPTIRTGRTLRVDEDSVTVDAGITLRQCIDALDEKDRELLVVPNYSYISLGTVYFVPVHGSGSEVSTLGDTIEWVKLYDPQTDTITEAHRRDPVFRQFMYDLHSHRVVLQLRLKTRRRSGYYVEQQECEGPSAEEVWELFDDRGPSNIEVRKHRAADRAIHVSKYYTSGDGSSQRLEVPRDSIGSLWDRLEENRVTAFLFHWLVRHLAFHVELFLREAEFHAFWEQHSTLPLSKIQLRVVRRDGIPHSPFCDEDCVSADLFMSKRHRKQFLEFAAEFLPDVRCNPGKQSMRGRDE